MRFACIGSLLILALALSPAMAEQQSDPGKPKVITDDDLGTTLTLPIGFEPIENYQPPDGRDIKQAFQLEDWDVVSLQSIMPTTTTDALLWAMRWNRSLLGIPESSRIQILVENLPGALIRSEATEQGWIHRGASRVETQKWNGFDIQVVVQQENKDGTPFITRNARIPTTPTGIQITVTGPASQEAEITAISRGLIDSLEGPTSWLTEKETWRYLPLAIALLAAGAVGVVICARFVGVWLRNRFRNEAIARGRSAEWAKENVRPSWLWYVPPALALYALMAVGTCVWFEPLRNLVASVSRPLELWMYQVTQWSALRQMVVFGLGLVVSGGGIVAVVRGQLGAKRLVLADMPSLPAKIYTVGTLKYTMFGLTMMFIWMFWGDFVFTVLGEALSKILPLVLKHGGASDYVNQVVNKTLGYAITFMLAPVISVRSDRHRGRWGRRMPFLLWSTPFVGLFLVGIGLYSNIAQYISGGAASVTILGYTMSQASLAVLVLAVLVVGYDMAGMFVNTLYYYLFNDVVPAHLLSRFLSIFRMVGTAGVFLYNTFLLQHAETHFTTIIVAIGIAYVVGFMAMCIFVKEGKYPPPPANLSGKKGFVATCETYARECFTHRLYWYFFLANTFTFLAGMTGTFTTLRNTDTLGLTLKQLGLMNGISAVISFFLQYPCGWAADRWNPLRVYVISAVLNVLGALAACVWCVWDFGKSGNLVYLWITSLMFMPIMAVNDAAELPMYMRILPKDRYGQFCSANALIRSFALIFGSMASGIFMSSLGFMGDWHYRFVPVWEVVFRIPAVIFIILLFVEWKKRGGNVGYTPPSVDEGRPQTVTTPAPEQESTVN